MSVDDMPTLVLTPRFSEDSQALWRAAVRLGWDVQRLPSWSVPDDWNDLAEPVFYLEGLFGPTISARFQRQLLFPPLDWLPRLPEEYRRREVHLMNGSLARQLTRSAFIKPPNDKSFPAQVYAPGALPDDVPADAPVLVSEPVVWEVEFRCFVLDREPRTASVYLRNGEFQRASEYAHSNGELTDAMKFVARVLHDPRVDLPRATVLDVGVIQGRGWAVVEQNAAWGSGIYGCDPEKVLEVLRFATGPDRVCGSEKS